MLLWVLGSGSKGNAFALETPEGLLLVEAGFGAKAMMRRAAAAGLNLERTTGIVVSHEHGDHARGAVGLAQRLDVPVVCSAGTWRALGSTDRARHQPVRPTRPLVLDDFTIDSCVTTHDAAEPLALVVEVSGTRVAFITDLGRPTTGVRYLLRGVGAAVVESNHDELMLRTGRYPAGVQERIASSRGHLSNRVAAELLAESCHPRLAAVVLVHLSQECNTRERARSTVEPVLRARGFRGRVYVAEQDRALAPIRLQAAPGRDQGELALRWDEASAARPS